MLYSASCQVTTKIPRAASKRPLLALGKLRQAGGRLPQPAGGCRPLLDNVDSHIVMPFLLLTWNLDNEVDYLKIGEGRWMSSRGIEVGLI